jgi:hypothetical protein
VDTPTYNAEGLEVWKPQPGQTWPGGLRFRESYGGIVATINDLALSQGNSAKSYPQNFAGIIAALEDLQQFLTEGELPTVDDYPPGWEIITNGDGDPIGGDFNKFPPDGTLWFDTRQGRLFIAIDKQFWQTNGADGISHVGPNPPTNPPVIGQHWLDTDSGLFYVYIGEGVWQAVVSDGDITITTATLPLAIARSAFPAADIYQPQLLPDLPSMDAMQVQKDYNTWLMEALVNLDKAVTEGAVTVGDAPPTENLVSGTLWYDSRTLELSIYYSDDDSSQWVPVSVGYEISEIAGALDDKILKESQTRAQAVDHIYSLISSMDTVDDAAVAALDVKLTELEAALNNISIPDVTPYATNTALATERARISALETAEIDFSPYAKTSDVTAVHSSLLNTINSKTYLELSDVTPLIPDVSNKVEQSDIDASIAGITVDYLPRTGGTVTGSFIINKEDLALPAFDVSSHWYNSKDLFKLKAYSPTETSTTFGATEKWWEVAWKFANEEDFAWIYNDTDKVFSITKEGPACSALYLGNFAENTIDGRRMQNKMEVGERLRTYEQAFVDMRQAIASSTDYASLKAGLSQALLNV